MKIIMLRAMFTKEIYKGGTYLFPFLGQLAFLGVLDGITWACRVPSIRTYNPACMSHEPKRQSAEDLPEWLLEETIKEWLENATWTNRWFPPEDAWKTVHTIHHLLLCGGSGGFLRGIEGIRDDVVAECRYLLSLLESASLEEIRFKIEFEEMKYPPAELVDWTNRYMERTYTQVRAELEAAGIMVREEEGNKNRK